MYDYDAWRTAVLPNCYMYGLGSTWTHADVTSVASSWLRPVPACHAIASDAVYLAKHVIMYCHVVLHIFVTHVYGLKLAIDLATYVQADYM